MGNAEEVRANGCRVSRGAALPECPGAAALLLVYNTSSYNLSQHVPDWESQSAFLRLDSTACGWMPSTAKR